MMHDILDSILDIQPRHSIRRVTIKWRRQWEEYRVPSPDGSEAGAYYTDDLQDAIDTAQAMYHGEAIDIKTRSIA